jgi:hypothetical protein
MNTTTASHHTRAAAVVAGLIYVAIGVATLTGSSPDEHWGVRGAVVDLLGLVGFAATVLGSERLVPMLGLGRAGRACLRVAQVGLVAMVVESTASLFHGGNTLWMVFFGGLVLALLGFLGVGIDGLRRRAGRAVALLPFLALLVAIAAGDHGGFVVLGIVWLAIGASAPAARGARTAAGTGLTERADEVRPSAARGISDCPSV